MKETQFSTQISCIFEVPRNSLKGNIREGKMGTAWELSFRLCDSCEVDSHKGQQRKIFAADLKRKIVWVFSSISNGEVRYDLNTLVYPR